METPAPGSPGLPAFYQQLLEDDSFDFGGALQGIEGWASALPPFGPATADMSWLGSGQLAIPATLDLTAVAAAPAPAAEVPGAAVGAIRSGVAGEAAVGNIAGVARPNTNLRLPNLVVSEYIQAARAQPSVTAAAGGSNLLPIATQLGLASGGITAVGGATAAAAASTSTNVLAGAGAAAAGSMLLTATSQCYSGLEAALGRPLLTPAPQAPQPPVACSGPAADADVDGGNGSSKRSHSTAAGSEDGNIPPSKISRRVPKQIQEVQEIREQVGGWVGGWRGCALGVAAVCLSAYESA